MNEHNGERTVNIPIDEYFDLRLRAETNAMLMNELGEMKGRFLDIERRLWFLEGELKERSNV